MSTRALALAVSAALSTGMAASALADDGELLRKSMSSSSGTTAFPIPEAEHAFIDFMKFYVPAQSSSGDLVEVVYTDAEGVDPDAETRTEAKPLVGVYIYGPVVGVDGTGFVGHGARDAFAAVSLDDGNTWKRTNLSESADKSSFTVSVPFPDPTADTTLGLEVDDPDGLLPDSAIAVARGGSGNVALSVEGSDAAFKDEIEVRDAQTQLVLGSTRAKRDGTYEVRVNNVEPVPCYVQVGLDDEFGLAVPVEGAPENCATIGEPPLITEYPGDVINIFHAVAGNRVIVAWPSRYCQTGTPGYTVDADPVTSYLGIDNTTDLYLTDLFGVAGSQGSVDYSNDEFGQNQPVGEVPFSCLWTARGVLVTGDDPNTDASEQNYMVWFKPERLTSGRRDVNRVEIRMVEGAGAVVTWQEDPEGLRPGQGEGPGEGWSGAIANNQTDVWYSFLPWEEFDTVVNEKGEPVALAEYTEAEKPGHYVPFAVPMRLTNNAKCNAEGVDDPYCYGGDAEGEVADEYGLPDLCADTATIPQGQNREGDICIAESGLPNIGNTAATRPRLSLQPRDTNDDGETDSAWVVVIAEEDKGFGRYAFLVGEEPTTETARPCEEGTENCEVADQGKNIWYYSFDMGDPATSAGIDDPTSLVSNLVSQGNMLNQAETDWRTGAFYPPMSTADMWNFIGNNEGGADYNFLLYRTEIARRGSLLVQGTAKAALGESGLTALPAWKQGLLNQGGPADVMVRRIVYDFDGENASANPYDFANMVCGAWTVEPDSNPYYPKGLCADPAINLSGVTPEACDTTEDSAADGSCPTIAEDGTTADDPADQQIFDKTTTWFQCPGSDLCGDNILGSNLDDQSWHNPLEVAKGHRGFLDGDFAMMLYAWSPNWKLNAVGRDRYELYIRRSFDGGVTWTTLPADDGGYTGTDGVSVVGMGTTTCETMRDGATFADDENSAEDTNRCQFYAAGEPEQARNVSQLKSQAFTILDPRYTPTATSIEMPSYSSTDVRNASRYFIVYETGDNTTTIDGEPEPLDLFYGRAVRYGDDYQVWSEEDTALTTCLPDGSPEFPVVDTTFCNEFDDLEGRRETESGEASVVASPAGDFLYSVWSQAELDGETGELIRTDAMFGRVWYLDNFIPEDAPINTTP